MTPLGPFSAACKAPPFQTRGEKSGPAARSSGRKRARHPGEFAEYDAAPRGPISGDWEAVVAHPTASHGRPAHEMLVPAPPRPAVFPHPTVWTSARVTVTARPLPGLKVWRLERWRGRRNQNRGAGRFGARFFQELGRNQAQASAAAAQAQTVTTHLSESVSHRVLAAD